MTCEEKEKIDSAVRPLIGKRVTLTASMEGVTLEPAGESEPSSSSNGAAPSSSSNGAKPPVAVASKIKKVG